MRIISHGSKDGLVFYANPFMKFGRGPLHYKAAAISL